MNFYVPAGIEASARYGFVCVRVLVVCVLAAVGV